MFKTPTMTKIRDILTLSLGALVLAASASAAAGPDPVVGLWYGTAGTPADQSGFGLEVKEGSKGEMAAALYLDVMNWFGEALPPLQKTGSKYEIPGLALALTLEGDTLVGTMGRQRVEMKRVTSLPKEPPVPADIPMGPAPRWKTSLGAAIYASVAVRDGIAYVGTAGGVFNAIKMVDGTFAWTFSAGRPIFGQALLTEDAVYFACDNGFLFKLNRATGEEIWRYDLGDAQVPRILPHSTVYDYDHDAPMPVIAEGVLYVGSGDASVHAVDASTGRRVWRIGVKGKVRNTALIVGDALVFGTWGNELRAVERATGKDLWIKDLKAPVTSVPAMIDSRLVVGTRGSALLALDPKTGERLWDMGFWGSWVESSAVSGGDGLGYIGSSDLRRITSFDPKTGRIIWRTDVYGAPWGKPLVTDKFVYDGVSAIVPYMTRHVGGVVALDRVSGKLAWRYPLPNPSGTLHYGFAGSPTRSGDTFVIGGLDGALYAFPIS